MEMDSGVRRNDVVGGDEQCPKWLPYRRAVLKIELAATATTMMTPTRIWRV
jgi:hypothetical protein